MLRNPSRHRGCGDCGVVSKAELCWVQLVRDLVSWCGLRQVSRRTFVRALQDKGSVMLVPGGQAELVHTWRIKRKQEYVVYGGHKGKAT